MPEKACLESFDSAQDKLCRRTSLGFSGTATWPRSGWSDSLARMALNGGRHFAFVHSPLLPSGCFVAYSFQPRLAQRRNMTL
jgi:hypothetical protein